MIKPISYNKIAREYNLSIIDTLKNISQPIEMYGIQFLTFRRFFSDGKLIHVTNNREWLDYSFEHELWRSTSSLQRVKKIKTQKQFAHIWQHDAHKLDPVYKAMYQNNLWNGLTLYDKREEYVDLWAFATDRDNTEVMDLYVNQLDVIKRFILYLHDKAHEILLPNTHKIHIQTEEKVDLFYSNNKNNGKFCITNPFDIKRYYLDFKYQSYLTEKEFNCIYYLSRGKSFKSISKILNISPRTVESRINSVKVKTDSNYKEEMIEKCQYLLNMGCGIAE